MKRIEILAVAVGVAFSAAACVPPPTLIGLKPRSAAHFGLRYVDEGASVKLAYGAPDADDVGFIIRCAKGSHVVAFSNPAQAEVDPVLTLGSAGRVEALQGVLSGGDGPAVLTVRTRSDIAPLKAFRKSGRIAVGYAGAKYEVAAEPDEKAGVDRFFEACDRAA